MTAPHFDLEAHRGGRALFPENTLPSFAYALSLGVDTLELDMGLTHDGVIIVSHERRLNPDLARDAHGGYVAPPGTPFIQMALAEVKQYDVGQIRPESDYARRFPEQQQIPGTRIPTLAEVIALVKRAGNRHVRLNIETKIDPLHPEDSAEPAQFVAALLGLLQREIFSDRVMVQSFDWRSLQLIQQRAPSIQTVYLSTEQGPDATVYHDQSSPWTAGFDPMHYAGSLPRAVKAAGGAIWSPSYHDVTAALIDQAHELGVQVVVWTVNDPLEMTNLIDLRVDGIISDRPDLLRRVVMQKGLPVAEPTPVQP